MVEAFESTATETVIEEVQTVVTTQETTQNTVCLNCTVIGDTTGDTITWDDVARFGYQGGTIYGTINLDEYLTQQQINYGFDAVATIDTMTCLNTIGSNQSCEDVGNPTPDTLSITITVTDGRQTYTDTTEHTIDWNPSTFKTVGGTLSVPANNLDATTTATLSFYGVDNGFWAGHFGPTIQDPSLVFEYTVTEIITQQIEREIERTVIDYVTTELLTYDEILDSTYIGSPVPVIDIVIEPVSDTTFSVEVVEVAESGVEVIEVLEVEVETEMKVEQPVEETTEETEEAVQESSSNVEERVEAEEQTNSPKPTAKTAAKKSTGYSTALNSVKVALMVQNQSTQAFKAYQKEIVPDVPFYSPTQMDGGQTVDSPMGRWMTGASEVLWDNMVDLQWQK